MLVLVVQGQRYALQIQSDNFQRYFHLKFIYYGLLLFILKALSSFSLKLECMKTKQKSIKTLFTVLRNKRAAACPGRHIILLMGAAERDRPVFTCFYPRNSSHVFRPPIVKAL